jgi:hypothetical protein
VSYHRCCKGCSMRKARSGRCDVNWASPLLSREPFDIFASNVHLCIHRLRQLSCVAAACSGVALAQWRQAAGDARSAVLCVAASCRRPSVDRCSSQRSSRLPKCMCLSSSPVQHHTRTANSALSTGTCRSSLQVILAGHPCMMSLDRCGLVKC